MIKGHHDVKLIGFFGSESIGKTSTSYMLTGRLRSHGLLAEVVTDSSAAMPFPPERFDTHEAAWMYVITRKIMRETEYALRSNVKVIVSDRTPLDLMAYFCMKHPESRLISAIEVLVREWMPLYDLLYFFPAEGTEFHYDEFREPTDDSRNFIDSRFTSVMDLLEKEHGGRLRIASGSYRERAEFIYHDVLSELTGNTKPKRVVEQVRKILEDQGIKGITEIRMLGSRSVTRSHIASDNDDFDLLVVVDEDALPVHRAIQDLVPYLENACEATIDIKAVTKETMPHEV